MKPFRFDLISFILGILSVFLYGIIGLLPVAAIVFGFCSLLHYAKYKNQKLWQGATGLALGIIYTILAVYMELVYYYT